MSTDHTLDRRPDGVDDATVRALGTLGEAVEAVERARGHLYSFHQLCGTADLKLGEAVEQLREAGHDEVADELEREIIGRNVLEGRWSFQIVEEYDDGYWSAVRAAHRGAMDHLAGGVRHIHEAEMKTRRITSGHPDHRSTPQH
jgi:hypothetical protein